MDKSRFPNFYQLPIKDRIEAVFERGLISEEDYKTLKNQQQCLDLQSADKMIENVIGVMGMPVGLGLNFSINNKDYVVPLAVEEPSIVAALSSAAKIARIITSAVIENPPQEASVLNVNVPNLPLNEMAGWRNTKIGFEPMRSLSKAELITKPGHAGSYKVDMNWGDPSPLPEDTDGGAVMKDYVSLTWLGYIPSEEPPKGDPTAQALDKLFTQ